MAAAAEQLPRIMGWRAELSLGFRDAGHRTLLAERRHSGPLAVQRPFYPEGAVCHVYLLHPPGGVVGGDVLDIDVQLAQGTKALLTTPGAAKFYRSGGASARQSQRITVQSGATLEWLPQESIFFPGAKAVLQTQIALQGDARLALWEIQCLGRPAIDEDFDRGSIDNRLAVTRDGAPILLERLRIDADSRRRLSLMGGMPVAGIFLISGAGEAEVRACGDLFPVSGRDTIGATLIDDLLVVRYLGDSTERARRQFSVLWQTLRPRVFGRPASTPRIWAT
jgi:urease accessory protein